MDRLGVAVGMLSGLLLRYAHLDSMGLELLGFPGELMLSGLKALVLPLIGGSMVAGDALVLLA